MTRERVKITSCHVVYRATVEGIDENGRVTYEAFEIGSQYSLDVMALSEEDPFRVRVLQLVEGLAEITLDVESQG